jgi:hypothetical protein
LKSSRIHEISEHLLEPYTIPPSTPYLSEDQRELSELTVEGRFAWMAEWLALARTMEKYQEPLFKRR